MSDSEQFEELAEYEFKPSSGPTLKLHAMSDRQRTRFLNLKVLLLQNQAHPMLAAYQKLMEGAGKGTADIPDEAELKKLYKPYHKAMCELVEMVGDDEAGEIVKIWDDPGDIGDLSQLFTRIIQAESNILQGKAPGPQLAIPVPENVDEMSDQEVASLGEPSAASTSVESTSPTGARAATSSRGAKRSRAKKQKT